MKRLLFISSVFFLLLVVVSPVALSQPDRNRPKPKTTDTRGVGIEPAAPTTTSTPAPGTPNTTAAPTTQSSTATAPVQATNRRRKVMVADFDARGVPQWWGNWDIGSIFSNTMVTRLSSSGTYDVVERERMKAILEEQNLGQDERFRQDKVTKIGQLLGADYVLFGYLTNFVRKKSNKVLYTEYSAVIGFTVRLVDVASGTVVRTAEVNFTSKDAKKMYGQEGQAFNPNDPDFLQSLFGKAITDSVNEAVQKLSDGGSHPTEATQSTTGERKLTSNSVPAPPNDGRLRGAIAAVDGNTVIINRGQSQGVKVGDIFEVTRGGITDPETGRILRPKVIAEIRITNVEDGSADGEIVSQKDKIVAKDTIQIKTPKP